MSKNVCTSLTEHVLGIVKNHGGCCGSKVLFCTLKNTKRANVYGAIRALEGLGRIRVEYVSHGFKLHLVCGGVDEQ